MVMDTTTVFGLPAPTAGTAGADYDTEFAAAMDAADAALSTSPVVTVSGTTHTTAATDVTKTLRCTSSSATTVTVDNLTEGQHVNVLQAGTGAVSVAAGSGWTVEPTATLDLAGQWAMATIYCDATDHAVLTGYIA